MILDADNPAIDFDSEKVNDKFDKEQSPLRLECAESALGSAWFNYMVFELVVGRDVKTFVRQI
jgi:hypothetical protein